MDHVGTNLNTYPYLEVLEARSAQALRNTIAKIGIPYKIMNIYASNGKHYAWIHFSKKVTIIKQEN